MRCELIIVVIIKIGAYDILEVDPCTGAQCDGILSMVRILMCYQHIKIRSLTMFA